VRSERHPAPISWFSAVRVDRPPARVPSRPRGAAARSGAT
jgi:hypothetical protein